MRRWKSPFIQTCAKVTSYLLISSLSAAAPVCAQTSPPTLNVPNQSSAPPAGSPIEVEDCKLQEIGGLLLAKSGKLLVEFTNESNVTADLVRFRVGWGSGGDAAFIRDQGRFAPGITVKHLFKQSEGELISPLFSHPNLHCTVEEVHFTDGSEWTSPDVAASSAPPVQTDDSNVAAPLRFLGSGYIGTELRPSSGNTIVIHLVLPGSPADIAGLRQGDILESINGEHFSSLQDAVDLITSSRPGSLLKFSVQSTEGPRTLTIKVAQRPADAPPDGPV